MDASQTSQTYHHETSVLAIYLFSMSPNLQPLNFDFELSIFVKTLTHWLFVCIGLIYDNSLFHLFLWWFMCSVVHYCG